MSYDISRLEYELGKLREELKYTAKNTEKYIEVEERIRTLTELIGKQYTQFAVLKYIH